MKITLLKKSDSSDKDPLLCQWETEENGKLVKKTIKVKIGQSLDIPDEEAYVILAKYRGLFGMAGVNPTNKSMKAYPDKAIAT